MYQLKFYQLMFLDQQLSTCIILQSYLTSTLHSYHSVLFAFENWGGGETEYSIDFRSFV